MDAKLVLDISHWDAGIDLNAWKNERDLWGVIIKAGGNERNFGRYEDSEFKQFYYDAKRAGLHIGFYYYTVSTDEYEVALDANHFADLLNGLDYDLPCYIDVEDPAQVSMDARSLTNLVIRFCETLNSRGYYSGVYTMGSTWLGAMYPDELNKYANWIAWWRANWPTEAGDIGLWQQGGMRLSDGAVVYDDVSGFHDCNWCIVDYPSRIASGGTSYDSSGSTSEPEPPINQNEKPINGTAESVINAAYGELGYYAPDDPEPGSKYGRWMAEITGEDWLAGPSSEIWWCCMFASWCLDQGGVVMDGFPTQNTDLALNGGAINYSIDIYDVQYGDIVIFNWNWDDATDHIGFATGSFDGTGFPTIEGNLSNAVKEQYRQMGNVAYVLRPPYGASSEQPSYNPGVSEEPKNNRDGGKLDVDGIGGWNTIIDLQNQLGTVEDGWISGQYSENRQYHSGMSNVTYDEYGSSVVKALQTKVNAEADGHWGPNTSRTTQQWLVDHGYSVGTCGVDGYFGHDSVVALQQSLNDGKWK